MNDVKLPPLPEAEFILDGTMSQDGYTADQMREYARLAVLQEREQLALAWESAHGFDKYGVAAFIRSGHSVTETKRD